MSMLKQRRRWVAGLAAAALAIPLLGPPAAAQPGGQLGAVTGIAVDGGTVTLTAGEAAVRVVFLKDDVFRLWLAPDGEFTDPASTAPPNPDDPASTIVVKRDYPAPTITTEDKGDYYALRTGKAEVRAYKNPLRFALHRGGEQIWAETAPLAWTDKSATQSLSRGATEQYVGGGMQNGRFSHRDKTIRITRDFDWDDGGNPNASPYYMSTAGYGVLRNTFAPGSYTFAEPVKTTHDDAASTPTSSSATSRPLWTATPS